MSKSTQTLYCYGPNHLVFCLVHYEQSRTRAHARTRTHTHTHRHTHTQTHTHTDTHTHTQTHTHTHTHTDTHTHTHTHTRAHTHAHTHPHAHTHTHTHTCASKRKPKSVGSSIKPCLMLKDIKPLGWVLGTSSGLKAYPIFSFGFCTRQQ